MAIKILSVSEKNKLSMKELISYERKLRIEVNRRASRFDKDDYFFKEKANQFNSIVGANPRSKKDSFASSITSLKKEQLRIAISGLEHIINNPRSTKVGRKIKGDSSWETFRLGHEGFTRTKYNKLIKLLGSKQFGSGMQSLILQYCLSEQVVEVYKDGYEDNDIYNAILRIGNENLDEIGIKQVTGQMIIEVVKGANVNEVLERYRLLSNQEESNE